MSRDNDVIKRCLEVVAEADVDISTAVYNAFSQSMPESDEHLLMMDERMRGRMLDQVFLILLGETDETYMRFEARAHRDYGATPALYLGLLTAVKDTVRASMEQDWTDVYEAAWNRSIKNIVEDFSQVLQASPHE